MNTSQFLVNSLLSQQCCVMFVCCCVLPGEGIPDLLQLMVKLTQSMMQERLTLLNETQCTVRSSQQRA